MVDSVKKYAVPLIEEIPRLLDIKTFQETRR